jgi:hypothetical protein
MRSSYVQRARGFPVADVFVAFSLYAIPVRADPIRVTSGLLDAGFGPLGGPWVAETLVLTGAGFSIGGALEDTRAFVQLAALPTVAPGALLDLSGVLHVEDAINARLNNSFAIVAAPFKMSFVASPTKLACSSAGSLTECTGVAPFTFDADLTITPLAGVSVTHHLIGRGTAEGRLFRRGSLESGAVLYTFEASPVPEPATLSLFTTGAIMAGVGVWRRRRAGQSR